MAAINNVLASREGRVPRLTDKEATVLRLIISQPGRWYGLELVDASEGEIKRGTVYVTLGRMVEKGYLTSRREQVADESPLTIARRIYQVTGLGQRAYASHQAARSAFDITVGVATART